MTHPTIVLIGRRNVGKSAIFNRILEEDKAIVSPIPGTTRDRTEGFFLWRGYKIKIIDTGGLDIGREDLIEQEVLNQAEEALRRSHLIFFVVDLKSGPLPQEFAIAKKLQDFKNKIILVGNKADNPEIWIKAQDPVWQKFGFGQPQPVSAVTGAGIGDLLDLALEKLKNFLPRNKKEKEKFFKIAIVGRPNVGKSSLLNKILGEKRVIVSPLPHTTREPQDTILEFQGEHLLLIDTAGIRKKRVNDLLIRMGIEKSLKVIKQADLVFFLLEPLYPLPKEDRKIAGLLADAGVSVFVLLNKIDLLKEQEKDLNSWLEYLKNSFPQISFAFFLPISATTGKNINKLLPLALEVKKEREKKIPQKELDILLNYLVKKQKPARGKGPKYPVIYSIEQIDINPPQFVVWIGPRQSLHFSYLRFIENELRKKYTFFATPLRIWVRQKKF